MSWTDGGVHQNMIFPVHPDPVLVPIDDQLLNCDGAFSFFSTILTSTRIGLLLSSTAKRERAARAALGGPASLSGHGKINGSVPRDDRSSTTDQGQIINKEPRANHPAADWQKGKRTDKRVLSF